MKYYYTYILLSKKDSRFYAGYSADLGNRLKEHQKGLVFSTKHRLPVELIYYEACLNEYDALRREKYFKSGKGKKFLKKRLRRFLE
jgi:putative endonuclease